MDGFSDLDEKEMLTVEGGSSTILPYGGALLGGCLLGYGIGYIAA